MRSIKEIFIIIALIIPVYGISQPQNRTGYYEEQGEELINKASDKIKSFESLIIDFSYIVENAEQGTSATSTGIIHLKGNKYNIALDEHEYISDGETVWVCLKDVKEIHISYAENIEQSMNPVHLLNDFQKHYKAKLIRQDVTDQKFVNLVDVIPNRPHTFFKYRVAILDNDMLSYIEAYDRHGGTYNIRFDNVKKNKTIDSDIFQFDESKFTDMDIIDLR